jgi:hypothetical protein
MHKLLHERKIAGDGVFKPETVTLMTAAFDDAWQLLQDSDVIFASASHAEKARVTLAKYIIEAVNLGERNQLQLRDDALTYYAKLIVARPRTDRK